MKTITFKNFNSKHPYQQYFIKLGEEQFIFTVRWNEYAQCATLDISDYNDNSIIKGRALVNGLIIRNHLLPYTLIFSHKDSETYEPTLDILEDEFKLVYFTGDDDE